VRAPATARSRTLVAMVLITLLAVACLPEPATREGRSIGGLYGFVLILALIVAVLIWTLLTVAIVRFRRRRSGSGVDSVPPQIRGHIGLEALWTFVPLLTILGIFGLTLMTLDDVERRDASEPVELHVEAFRWGWRFTYPAEGVQLEGVLDPGPEAILPVGRPVRVTLTSADVVHAFYVPQFLYKRDAIPGQTRVFELTIEQEAIYAGQCAEFCGLFHSRMPFSIRAVGQADYDAWLAEQRSAP
jgi:cytochrome c oxidase subunit II